jgi:rubrerythrin
MNNFTEIIRFAIDREIEAEAFYLEVAAKVTKETIQQLFIGFAKEEKRHQQLLTDALNNKETTLQFKEVSDYKLSESLEKTTLTPTMTLAEVFNIAMKNEEAAMIMYRKLAEEATSEYTRKLFENLAVMEQGHKVLLEERYVDVAYGEVW